ncbi:hypothetical protein SSUST3_1319 [Streptococcus suis ST3]|nr:hypothetical protein SSUST3_1319 [Streptococcus suis ST3]AER17652.1 hypothetical protein SSUD9_1468 [Streptococcus suis D9]AGW87672.1 hypothetical protein YB51_6500 [Streptococcus suis YB51]
MLLIKAVFWGMGSSPVPLLRVRVNISAQWLIGFNSPVDC